MAWGEGSGLGGKDLENPIDAAPALNRQGDHRAQAQSPADLDVDAGIVLGIGAMLGLASAQTLAGNAGVGTQLGADGGRSFAAARTADHGPIFPHGDGRTSGSCSSLSSFGHSAKNAVQFVATRYCKIFEVLEDGGFVR